MNFFYQPRLSNEISFLDGDEAHHATRVLRLKIGDPIVVTNGLGWRATATISSIEKDTCHFRIGQMFIDTFTFGVHIIVAPTKNADRIEWLVEKATEIGVHSIEFVKCEHSERKMIAMDRLTKVAISAMKQSQRSHLLKLRPLTPFRDGIVNGYDQKFIAYVDHSNPEQLKNLAKPARYQNYSILVGPEGDFTDTEINLALANGWKKVSLGPTRLRTETAALVAAVTLVQLNS
ncbi:MAG TPA: RsmE family RNA methyltransferase [Cyclobacteriaceae bacterium]